jgi:hypothetical protein
LGLVGPVRIELELPDELAVGVEDPYMGTGDT